MLSLNRESGQEFSVVDGVMPTYIGSAPGGGRTHTWRILSPLPLPLGYRGVTRTHLVERKSTGFGEDLLHRPRLEYSGKGVLLAWMVGTE